MVKRKKLLFVLKIFHFESVQVRRAGLGQTLKMHRIFSIIKKSLKMFMSISSDAMQNLKSKILVCIHLSIFDRFPGCGFPEMSSFSI